jgi:hypothetical protein
MSENGDLQVWWIPQVPMSAFEVPVQSEQEAALVLDTLARYDLFQLEHHIKPDYANVGGLCIFEDDEWVEWYKEGYWGDFDDYRSSVLQMEGE